MDHKNLYTGDLLGGQAAGFGRVPTDVMIVGDNPPRKSIRNGMDTYTESVRGLWKVFQDAFEVNFYFTFLIKNPLPKGKKRDYVKKARAGFPLLMEEIQIAKPKRIIVYGYHASRMLCPDFQSTRADHGAIFYNPELGVEVVPTFDPLVAFYDNERKEYFLRDIQRVFSVDRPEPTEIIYQGDKPFVLEPGVDLILDIETGGDDPLDYRQGKITMLGYYQEGGKVHIVREPSPEQIRALHREITNKSVSVIGHNFKFDLKFLSYNAKELLTDFPVKDTMLQARVAGERVLSLKHLASTLTDLPGSHAFGNIESPQYLAQDLFSTAGVYKALGERVPDDNPAFRLLNIATRAFTHIEIYGAYISLDELNSLEEELNKKVLDAREILNTEININSPDKVGKWLVSRGVKLKEKTETGQYKTGAEILKGLKDEYPVVQALLDYREAEKLQGYVTEYLEKTSQEYPYVNSIHKLWGARSGRISSEDPNLQNAPPFMKQVFESRFQDGVIGYVDLDQAEMRVACILANDVAFAEMLLSEDAHRAIASLVFEKPQKEITENLRKIAKIVSFGLILYGGTAWGIGKKVGVKEEVMDGILKKFHELFPDLTTLLENMADFAENNLYITSPLGRKRDLVKEMEIGGKWSVRRMGKNTPIQTTASDVTLTLVNGIWKQLVKRGLKSMIFTSVHDSIVLDIHPYEIEAVVIAVRLAFLKIQEMVLAEKFPMFWKVPFTGQFQIGETWYKAEKEPLQTWEMTSLPENT